MGKDLIKKVHFPDPGKYIVAVSGGVDSMSLLDVLANHSELDLIVAHFDHGIREDSHLDMELAHNAANDYGCEFVGAEVDLGASASEGVARQERYHFLESVREEYGADAIITAHHLDDRLETMLLNQQRGAGWRGLAPLRETPYIKRPLLDIWKREIINYAKERGITWREDSTNEQQDTPRNYIRAQLSRDENRKDELYRQLRQNDAYRDKREAELGPVVKEISSRQNGSIVVERSRLLSVDTDTARDVLFCLLQANTLVEVSKKKILRLEHFAKTALPGKQLPLSKYVLATAEPKQVRITLG